jgi:hypothetical protein
MKSLFFAVRIVASILCFALVSYIGFIFFVLLTAIAEGFLRSPEIYGFRNAAPLMLVSLSGLFLTSIVCLRILRKVWPWKPRYNPVAWARRQSERKLHPARVR